MCIPPAVWLRISLKVPFSPACNTGIGNLKSTMGHQVVLRGFLNRVQGSYGDIYAGRTKT